MGNLLDTLTGKKALREELEREKVLREELERAKVLGREELEREKVLREELERAKVLGREELEREKALRIGKYYAIVDEVLRGKPVVFSQADYNSIRRNFPHPFYGDAIAATENEILCPAYDSSRSEFDPGDEGSSLQTDDLDGRTEKNRKRRLKEISIDGGNYDSAEVAHLLPYAQTCARLYGMIAEAATGFETDEVDRDKKRLKLQVLIHGQYKTTTKGKTVRARNTGIKHCRTNMARIVAQKRFLDFDPSLLILPILSLADVLSYEGGPYHVLVITKAPKVYKETIFTDLHDLCSVEEVKQATETLASFVKGLAHVLQMADDSEIDKLGETEKIALKTTKEAMRNNATVIVPETAITGSVKLAKLRFDLSTPDAHQESDPFLLMVKSAVVWSSMKGQKLLPGCPPPHHCEECLELGHFTCDCEAYDPSMPIPSAIHIRRP